MSTSELLDVKLKRHRPSKKGGLDAFEVLDTEDVGSDELVQSDLADVVDPVVEEDVLSLESDDESHSDSVETSQGEVSIDQSASDDPVDGDDSDDSESEMDVSESHQATIGSLKESIQLPVPKRKKKSTKPSSFVSSVNRNVRRRVG